MITLKATLKKVCFLSSGWPKLWPLGRPQFFFLFLHYFFFFCGGGGWRGKKITDIPPPPPTPAPPKKTRKLKKKEVPSRHKNHHPAARLHMKQTFFKGGRIESDRSLYKKVFKRRLLSHRPTTRHFSINPHQVKYLDCVQASNIILQAVQWYFSVDRRFYICCGLNSSKLALEAVRHVG